MAIARQDRLGVRPREVGSIAPRWRDAWRDAPWRKAVYGNTLGHVESIVPSRQRIWHDAPPGEPISPGGARRALGRRRKQPRRPPGGWRRTRWQGGRGTGGR